MDPCDKESLFLRLRSGGDVGIFDLAYHNKQLSTPEYGSYRSFLHVSHMYTLHVPMYLFGWLAMRVAGGKVVDRFSVQQ